MKYTTIERIKDVLIKNNIHPYNGWNEQKTLIYCILNFIKITEATKIYLPTSDYLEVYSVFSAKFDNYHHNIEYFINHPPQMQIDNKPAFLIAGVQIIMLNKEDALKYEMLI